MESRQGLSANQSKLVPSLGGRSLLGAGLGGGLALLALACGAGAELPGPGSAVLGSAGVLVGGLLGVAEAYRARAARAEERVLLTTEAHARSLAELEARLDEVRALHSEADVGRTSLTDEMRRREQAESALVDAQKLEAVGRLSGGIAHDFNNLITIIMNYAELAKARPERVDQVVASMDAISHAATRASDLTHKLLAFARRRAVEPRVLTLEDQLRSLEGLLGRLVGEDVQVELLLEETASNVRMDPAELEQVILNLAANARDAMPKGGVLRLETRRISPEVAPWADGPGGERVELCVKDTGHGMTEPTRQRAFEPFFTTKEVGRGTGLGLPSSLGIVRQANGAMRVESEPGRGTTFRIVLPRVSDQPSGTRVRLTASPRGNGEALLVVEDDAGLRAIMEAVLTASGYRVVAARGAKEAVAALEGTPGAFAALVTDVVLREGDGYELSRRALLLCPGLPVLFVSGYSSEIIERHGISPGELHLLKKPFNGSELAREVRVALDRRAYGESVSDFVSSATS